MEFGDLIRARYSVRTFESREVEQEKVDAILQAADLAPTACNYQPFRIWVVRSQEGCRKIRDSVRFHFDAPSFLVVGANEDEAYTRDFDGYNFARLDAAIAATHMMLAIHDLGLGACWVGYYDEDRLRASFPEMQGYAIAALFPFGYPAEDAHPAKMHGRRKGAQALTAYL